MTDKVQIWHNSMCTKSQCAFEYLAENKIESEWFDYLNSPITVPQMKSVLKKLSIPAFDLIRKKEKLFIDNWKSLQKTEDEWIEIMIQNPQLIERPIVLKGEKAVIARPLEFIEQLFI